MACTKATPVVWMAIVAAVAIMVARNGRLCLAFDMSDVKDSVVNSAEEAKKGAESLYLKVSGKLSLDPSDMKQGAEDMMHKASETASDAKDYASAKLHSISHLSIPGKDNIEKFYDEAKNDVGAAYDSTAKTIVHED